MGSLGRVRLASLIAIAAVAALAAGCGSDSSSTEPTTVSVSIPAPASTTAPMDESTAPVPPDDSAGNPEQADDPGADRPRAIPDVVDAVMTASEKPEVICGQLVTPDYVKTAYGDRSGCVAAQQPGALADSVKIGAVQQTADSATVTVIPTGGPYDGHKITVKLIPATDLADAWVVDSLVAHVPAGP